MRSVWRLGGGGVKAASLTHPQREVLAALIARYDDFQAGRLVNPPSLVEVAMDSRRATSTTHSVMQALHRLELVAKGEGHRGYHPTAKGRKALKDAWVGR